MKLSFSVPKLRFNVQLNRGTIIMQTEVAALPSDGVVGDYFEGVPYQPDTDAVRAALPYTYRKAFDRALKWWQEESQSGRMMPLKCDLVSTDGEPMGTLYATPSWPAGAAGEVTTGGNNADNG